MRRLWFFIGIIIILSGCLTMRNYTKEEPRKDLEIEGNRGYLSGVAKEEPRENRLGDTRTISVVEIEFGPREIKKEAVKKEAAEEEAVEEEVAEEKVAEEEVKLLTTKVAMTAVVPEPVEKEEAQYYTVQKNDTLQKISHKFYGTTRKWNFIYKTNKDVLKSPDKLHPGVELLILPLD